MEDKETSGKKRRPTLTAEAREDELIALATDLAEKKLRDGTATSQMIIHYLKLGSPTTRLEKKLLQTELELKEAKTEQIKNGKKMEELYVNAINAMRTYQGVKDVELD